MYIVQCLHWSQFNTNEARDSWDFKWNPFDMNCSFLALCILRHSMWKHFEILSNEVHKGIFWTNHLTNVMGFSMCSSTAKSRIKNMHKRFSLNSSLCLTNDLKRSNWWKMSNFAYTFLQIVEIFTNWKFIRIFVKEFCHIWNENEFSRHPWFPWIASEWGWRKELGHLFLFQTNT